MLLLTLSDEIVLCGRSMSRNTVATTTVFPIPLCSIDPANSKAKVEEKVEERERGGDKIDLLKKKNRGQLDYDTCHVICTYITIHATYDRLTY